MVAGDTRVFRDGAWRRRGRAAIWPSSATVETVTRPVGAPAPSTKYAVTVNGDPTVVYATPDGHFANFAFGGGPVTVTVTYESTVIASKIYPTDFDIPTVDIGRTVTFTVDEAHNYVVEVNGHQWDALYLFANPLQDPPDPGSVTYYYGPGYYEGVRPDGTALAGQNLVLGSGQSAYFHPGAYFRGHVVLGTPDGTVQTGPRVSDIHVSGYGIVDSSPHPSVASPGRPTGVTQVDGASIIGPTFLGVTHWACIIAESANVLLERFKLINWRAISGDTPDGVDVIGSSFVTLRKSFLRAHDDASALKTFKRGFGTASPSGWAGSIEQVTYEDCTVINGDGGNGSEIGYENFATQQDGAPLTRTPEFIRDITYRGHTIVYKFRDPTIQYRMAGLGIHLVDRVPLSNVLYEDSAVENIITGQFAIWVGSFLTSDYDDLPDASTEAARAHITNLIYRRVRIDTDEVLPLHFQGGGPNKPINGLRLEDLVVNGHKVTSAGSVAGKYTWEASNVTGLVFA